MGQVMPAGHHRFRAQAALGGQVPEEPAGAARAEGSSRCGPASALQAGSICSTAADLRCSIRGSSLCKGAIFARLVNDCFVCSS